jgi:preprotein translocase subunit SecA
LEDELMRLFKADLVDAFLRRFNVPDDVPIEAKMVSNAIRSAQTQVEAQNFEIRKNVLKYDEVLNRQRQVIYGERREVLEGADLHEQVRSFLDDTVEDYVQAATSEGYPEEWDLEQLWTAMGTLYPVGISVEELEERSGGDRAGLAQEYLIEEIKTDAHAAYDRREEILGDEVMRELERRVVLSVLDRKWREHLYEMDYLQEGIGLRAMAQRDPLVEYQREGFDLFNAMMESIKEESVGYLFNVEVDVTEGAETSATEQIAAAASAGVGAEGEHEHHPEIVAKGLGPARPQQLQYSAPTLDGAGGSVSTATLDDSEYAGTARNAPCPCGSGKKYKRCHGDPRVRNQV